MRVTSQGEIMQFLALCLLIVPTFTFSMENTILNSSVIKKECLAQEHNNYIQSRLQTFNEIITTNNVHDTGLAHIFKDLLQNFEKHTNEKTMALATQWHTAIMDDDNVHKQREQFDLACFWGATKTLTNQQSESEAQESVLNIMHVYQKVAALKLGTLIKEQCQEFHLPNDWENKLSTPNPLPELLQCNKDLSEKATPYITAACLVVGKLRYPEEKDIHPCPL
jgi:hypothetical protein